MLIFPFRNKELLGATDDSMSFQKIDIKTQVEVPIGDTHVGAYGATRRFDRHKGIDLYAEVGELVYPVEAGWIVHIRPFTGVAAGCPWWCDTWAVSVEGKTGIFVYGEIQPNKELKCGDYVTSKDSLGSVLRVLKKDKGRPTSMLHIELHSHGILSTGGPWEIGADEPFGLQNPAEYLIERK